jgi:RimJ/RimL family protein N-acetyltransferase
VPPSPPGTIDAGRVRLRALQTGDGRALTRLYAANRNRLADSFPKSTATLVDDEAGEAYVAERAAEWAAQKGFWFGIWLGETLVGQIQIKNIDWSVPKGELAYLLDREAEGRGYMTETFAAILRVAFGDLGFRKLFLRAIMGNERSARLARRFGFTREGVLREEFVALDGRRVDLEYYGLLARELKRLS